jgi:Tfp pilus assembly protein PilW
MPSSRATSASRHPEHGATLIEALVAFLASAVLLAGFTAFALGQQRSQRQERLEIALSQELRAALDQMARELRAAGGNPARASGIGLVSADRDRVAFLVDWNGDGDALDAEESRGFVRRVAALETCDASFTVCENLATHVRTSGQIFRYFRADGSEITPLPVTDLAAIRRVDIELTLERADGPVLERTEVASVLLRNLS